MVRSAKGIERLANLVCISYAATRILPYYREEFKEYQGQSAQEVRYQLGEKIRMNIVIRSLGRKIETLKNNELLKDAFNKLVSQYG